MIGQHPRTKMQFAEYEPQPALHGYVDAFWKLDNSRATAPTNSGTILPDGCVEVVLCCGDPVIPSLRRGAKPLFSFVVGQMERPYRIRYVGRANLLGIRLHPAAARCLLTTPSNRLTNRITSLARLQPELDVCLAEAVRRPRHRLKRVSQVLEERMRASGRPDAVISAAVDAIRAQHGCARIGDLARSLAIGERRLQRKFEREVGLTPKRWARIIRFQAAFEASSNTVREAWVDLAARFGYADQAHMVREFAEFTGVAPSRAWWTHD